jgi:sialate O-acetylesterase
VKLFRSVFSLATLLVAVLTARADLKLPKVFGDHMVLQAGEPVPIWGWASPGETVAIRFAGQEKRAIADAQGRWNVQLDSLIASAKPMELVVAAKETRTLTDVLVGEVWLCSGQSNMEKPLGEKNGQKPVFHADEEIQAADFPQIRFFKVKKASAAQPANDVEGEWVACSPTTIDKIKFSAAGYFFGRKLHRELAVPVGLVDATWGGTRIEVWTPHEGFAVVPSLAEFAAAVGKPDAKVEGSLPSSLYNAMIHPLVPFALRGVIWYQGESNIIDVDDGARYFDKMTALIRGWREVWHREFAFYYVQVAPHLYHVVRPNTVVSPDATPRLWEAQTAAQSLPHTGMIVTTDLVDDLTDIHPRNKKDVGERLAVWALAKDYGQTSLEVSGPVFKQMESFDSHAILHFEHLGGGLASRDGKPLTWFTVAGADGRFYPATAQIEGDNVIVSSPHVSTPTVVHFAWDEAAQPNFINRAGLPAVPFRTDNPFKMICP